MLTSGRIAIVLEAVTIKVGPFSRAVRISVEVKAVDGAGVFDSKQLRLGSARRVEPSSP